MTRSDGADGAMSHAHRRDPVDAALRGEPVGDPALEALVQDLRRTYAPDRPLTRSPELASFAGTAERPTLMPSRPAATPIAAPARSRRTEVVAGIAAFVATLGGKVVLGGAVAAATVGGLHASDVVDVPFLPDVGAPTEQPQERPGPTDPSSDAPEAPSTRPGDGDADDRQLPAGDDGSTSAPGDVAPREDPPAPAPPDTAGEAPPSTAADPHTPPSTRDGEPRDGTPGSDPSAPSPGDTEDTGRGAGGTRSEGSRGTP